jgi:hypothetical protein
MKIILALGLALYGGVSFVGDTSGAIMCSFKQKEVITACLVLEAGSEGERGMQAVMNVIQNRAGGNPFNYYSEAIRPKQFSCLNSAKGLIFKDYTPLINKARLSKSWGNACKIVGKAYLKELPDITGGATHYYLSKMRKVPEWSGELQETKKIGAHRFMKVAQL